MLKRRLIALVVGVALLAAAAGATSVVADSLGLPVTPQVHACGGGTGGGDC